MLLSPAAWQHTHCCWSGAGSYPPSKGSSSSGRPQALRVQCPCQCPRAAFLRCQQPCSCPFSRLTAVSPSLLCFSEISSPTTFYWMSTVSARCSVVMPVFSSSQETVYLYRNVQQETSCALGACCCHPLVLGSPAQPSWEQDHPILLCSLAVSCFLSNSVLYLQGSL